MRRILFAQISCDLRHRHLLESHDRLEGFRLTRLFAAERADEYRCGFLESAESVQVRVQIVRGEIDRALVASLTAERAADVDRQHQRGTSYARSATTCLRAPEGGKYDHARQGCTGDDL